MKKEKNSNPIISNLVKLFFDLMKHFIQDFENIRKVKKIDKFDNNFHNLEHLIIKLQDKIEKNRMLLDEMKNRIFWGNIIIIILLMLNLFLIIR
jgi:hypothetical protein